MASKLQKTLEDSDDFKNIHNELIAQLIEKKIQNYVYEDMIKRYMNMWITCRLLEDDIKKRGVMVSYNNGGGQKGKKKNDSIQELNKTISQMLKILSEIGLNELSSDKDDDEL